MFHFILKSFEIQNHLLKLILVIKLCIVTFIKLFS